MKTKLMLLAAAAAAVVVALPAANAGAKADATLFGTLHKSHHGRKATLRVPYRCTKGDVLWISAKQTKSGAKNRKLKREGSSKLAHTWIQSHRNPINCNGKRHAHNFKLDRVEPGSKGHLVQGVAWVQFCITFKGEQLTLSRHGWVAVK